MYRAHTKGSKFKDRVLKDMAKRGWQQMMKKKKSQTLPAQQMAYTSVVSIITQMVENISPEY